MIHINTIRNMVHLAIAVNGKITSQMLANLFPNILGNLLFQPVRNWENEDSCMEFIEEHCKRIGVVLDNAEESKDEETFDVIAHPSHYTEGRKHEPRKVIADWGLNFNLGNAVKYLSRAGRKGNKVEDLKKAIQYIEFEIEEVQNEKTEA